MSRVLSVPARRTTIAALACLGAGAALGACGSSNNSTASSSGGTASTASAGAGYGGAASSSSKTVAAHPGTVTVKADPNGALMFDKTTLTAPAGKVTVAMVNPASSGLPHGIAVQGNGVDKDGKTVNPGGTSTVALTLKPGTYTFYCPVPGHKAAGMKGTLTVR